MHRHALVHSDGDWWHDPLSNEFGFRLGGREPREWTDTTWEFPGPDEYATLAARAEPGWFARAGEKAMHAAVISGDPHAIDVTAGQHPQYRNTADVLAGLMSLESRRSYASELLSRSIAVGFEPKDDSFIGKYMPDAGLVVPIAPGVAVALPIMRVAVALTRNKGILPQPLSSWNRLTARRTSPSRWSNCCAPTDGSTKPSKRPVVSSTTTMSRQ